MLFNKFMIVSSMYIFFLNFTKKLVSLLSLEIMMITLIFSFFLATSEFSSLLLSLFLLLLVMMVLDSVLGISLLISSCRSSSLNSYKFF